ncbi:vWA domain-containing protein [Hydrogenimonas sp.]
MTFLDDAFLWFLVSLVLFAWLGYREELSKRVPLHPKIVLESGRGKLVRLAPFFALGWMVIALARPVTHENTAIKTPSLNTLYLAIDASRSMMATDRKPNRYEFAKKAIESLVSQDSRHKFALIAFTTNALILSPPTEDREIVHAALESFRPEYVLAHGTSIEALLRYVAKLGDEEKNLVIFSDGGDDGDLQSLVDLAKRYRIKIFGIACGTHHGSKIPHSNGWLRDKNGHLVISMQNPLLERLALETGGVFIDENSPDEVASSLLSSVDSGFMPDRMQQVRYREWFWLPLAIGIVFLLAGSLSLAKLRRILVLLPFFAFLQADAGIIDLYKLHRGYELYVQHKYEESQKLFESIDPPLLESRYAQACALYRMGAFKKAGRLFAACKSSRPDIQQRIWYNLGNCAVKIGRYKSARDYYLKALQIKEDPDAKHNLKMVLFLIEKRKKIQAKANREVKAASSSGSSEQTKKSGAKKSNAKSGSKGGAGSYSASKATNMRRQKNSTASTKRHPLGSKVYEMINKGYVNEEKPW